MAKGAPSVRDTVYEMQARCKLGVLWRTVYHQVRTTMVIPSTSYARVSVHDPSSSRSTEKFGEERETLDRVTGVGIRDEKVKGG